MVFDVLIIRALGMNDSSVNTQYLHLKIYKFKIQIKSSHKVICVDLGKWQHESKIEKRGKKRI